MRFIPRIVATRWCCLAGLIVVGAANAAPSPHSAAEAAGATNRVLEWIQVAQNQSRFIYKGGTDNGRCNDSVGCASWAMRSDDSGRTWTDLGSALHLKQPGDGPVISINSFTVSADGQHIYVALHSSRPDSPDSSCSALVVSSDTGKRWSSFDPYGDSCANGAGPTSLVVSPLNPSLVYENDVPPLLDVSLDGGQSIDHSNAFPDAVTSATYHRLFADPTTMTIVYVYSYELDDQQYPHQARLFRTADGGANWSEVQPPVGAGGAFQPVVDPDEPGLLELRVYRPSGDGDRIYLSADHGKHWHTAVCPGVWQGECPGFTLYPTSGSNANWAFNSTGVYSFSGTGPARARLALSDHLPFTYQHLLDVENGVHQGDPIYLLGTSSKGKHNLLYRSTDAGTSWQHIG